VHGIDVVVHVVEADRGATEKGNRDNSCFLVAQKEYRKAWARCEERCSSLMTHLVSLRGEFGAQTGHDDIDGGVGPPWGERVRVSAILPDYYGVGGVRAIAELAGIVGDLSGIAALQSGRSIHYAELFPRAS
jgi:hypothetical protein